MTTTRQKALTLAGLAFLAYWVFGNIYEAVVIAPNWVVDSPAQLTRLNEFFVVTSPTTYFVPVGLLGPVLTWVLAWRNRDPALATAYRRAAWCTALAVALTAVVVATLLSRLFGADHRSYGAELTTYAWWWNALNVVRIALAGTAVVSMFGAFRVLDRR
jgi:hypothetical protein